MISTEETKKCPVCGFDLPRSMWPKNRASSSGYGSCCKPCSAAKSRKDRSKPDYKEKRKSWDKKYDASEKGKAAIKRSNNTESSIKRKKALETKYKALGLKTESYILRKYKLTREEYRKAKLLTHCSLCKEPFSEDKPMVVDHCHETGIVRGFIHQQCNSMIGFSGDSIDRLELAIEYFKEQHQMLNWFYYGI